ncbi:MAG: adenylate/guanylate cyclase domain-containing protein, partial [Marmoricola sp.]
GVLAWQDVSFGRAFAQWFVVTSTVAVSGMLIGAWAARAEQLSESEHAARTELAELNATLEERVSSQVDELQRLGRMRRFLSPQIARVVESEGDEELLRPHRRRVAVLFCDLRGFTAFTNRVEPEEVIEVLDEYYRTVGEILRERDATIGGYAGDGIMAYFGDPVPREAPSVDATAAALDVAAALDELCREWSRRGHDLGYGMGVALGYATLGTVGFDGRYDYTPLGTVVNLASRLCARAGHGEILIDHATQRECEQSVAAVEMEDVSLKGFGSDIRAFAIPRPAQA